jgi:hypothetical protein
MPQPSRGVNGALCEEAGGSIGHGLVKNAEYGLEAPTEI